MRLCLVRSNQRVIDVGDPDLSTIADVLSALGYRVEITIEHAHTGPYADCECNIIRGEE